MTAELDSPLVLAVPSKGRLQENATAFFARAGLEFIQGRGARDYRGAIADLPGVEVAPVESVGWNGDALEAQCFAHLAARVLHGLPLSFPGTTGVAAPCPGGRMTRP